MMTGLLVLDAVGIFLVAMAALHVWLKVGIWVDAGAGISGGAPELDGVIFPPLFFTVGLSFVVRHAVPPWGYLLIWGATTVLLYALMRRMFQVGEGPPARKRQRHPPVRRQRKRRS